MKKITIISVILILLAVSVMPVMAAGNSSNGHGNGNGNGQGNGASAGQNDRGNGDKTRDRDQTRLNSTSRGASNGASGFRNSMRIRTPFYLQGYITKVTDPMTITVSLIHGNAQVKQFIGTTLDLKVPPGTLIYKINQGGDDTGAESTNDEGTPAKQQIVFNDLKQFLNTYKVAIHGNVIDGVFTARLITVYIRTPQGETVGTP